MRLYDFIHGISVTYKGGFAITDLLMWIYIIGYVLYNLGIKFIERRGVNNMRIDLSEEQIECLIECLDGNIVTITKHLPEHKGTSVEDILRESIAIKKGTMLYLKDIITVE